MKRSRRNGSALLMALGLSFIATLVLGSTLLMVGRRLAYSRTDINAQSAQLVAEGAVNEEINYINDLTDAYEASAPVKATGEPYTGRKGTFVTADGTIGEYWVFTSSDAAGTTAWDGVSPDFYVQAVSRVKDVVKSVQVSRTDPSAPVPPPPTPPGSGGPVTPPVDPYAGMLGSFALFGVNDLSGARLYNWFNSNPFKSINIPSGAGVQVSGTVGTNGWVNGNSRITYTSAQNYGRNYNATGWWWTGASFWYGLFPQFVTSPFYNMGPRLQWMSVSDVLRKTYNLPNNTDPRVWLAANHDNAQIRTFKTSSRSLSPSGTQAITLTASQATTGAPLSNISDSYGTNGLYSKALVQGGIRTLIFPPGDYYFNDIDLNYVSTQELIIDFGGLTVGGNADRVPVRFWVYNSPTDTGVDSNDNRCRWNLAEIVYNVRQALSTDFWRMPVKMTLPGGTGVATVGDPTAFRVFYNKSSTLSLQRDSAMTGDFTLYGAFFSSSQNVYNRIFMDGGARGTGNVYRTTLYGALIADQVDFRGYTKIVYPPLAGSNVANTQIKNKHDPICLPFARGFKCLKSWRRS